MDIWAWVTSKIRELYDQGEDRLADVMLDIAHQTVEDNHDRVESLYREGLAKAQELGDKWSEIFLTHWYLQSQVLHQNNAKDTLPVAIDLLDLAHQEDTKDCPQRVCAVQDLANCYGLKDGAGYFEERKAVAEETLMTINGAWPCYECITSELICAYMDIDDYEGALVEIDKAMNELTKYDNHKDSYLVLTQTDALIGLKRYDEAWALIKDATNDGGGSSFERHRDQLKGFLLCKQGKYKEALEIYPPLEEINASTSYFIDYADFQLAMIDAGQMPIDQKVMNWFMWAAGEFRDKENIRSAIEMYEHVITLGLKIKAFVRVRTAIAESEKLLPQLYKDLGAREALDDHKAAFEKAKVDHKLPDTMVEDVHKSNDPALIDNQILLMQLKLKEGTDVDMMLALGRAYDAVSDSEASHQMLADAYSANPELEGLEGDYSVAFIQKHGREAYLKEFPLTNLAGLTPLARAYRGQKHVDLLKISEPEKALAALDQLLSFTPDHIDYLAQKAAIYMQMQDFESAKGVYQILSEIDGANKDHLWDLMITSSLLGDDAGAASYAKQLNLGVNNDGNYDPDKQGPITLIIQGDDGEDIYVDAIRLSPVKARVRDTIDMVMKNYWGHEYVFNPAPLNQMTEVDEDGDRTDSEGRTTYIYPSIKAVHQPRYIHYTIDGFHPGRDKESALYKLLTDLGVDLAFERHEGYYLEYTEIDEETGKEETIEGNGLYNHLLIPEGMDLKIVHDLLLDFVKDLDKPIVWPTLVKDLGLEDILKAQEVHCDKYGFY